MATNNLVNFGWPLYLQIMSKAIFIITVLLFVWPFGRLFSQPRTDNALVSILKNGNQPHVRQIMSEPGIYRCQIIYTQIDRDRNNIPHFTNFYFNYDSLLYFNPASTVKLPLACLALEKLKMINVKKLDKYTTIQFDSSYDCQLRALTDSTSESGLPSLANYIKRAFLISENDPYNRFYQFVGQAEINRSLHRKGYKDVRITREFMGYSQEQNRHTNPVRFLDENGKLIYEQPEQYSTDSFDFSHTVRLGTGYLDAKDSLVNEPYDFTRANNISLLDLQQILQSVLFPNSVPPLQRFKLSKDDHQFLLKFLSQYPSETRYPFYDTTLFYDSYAKFYFQDSSHHMPPGIRVFNKVGWAYGFLTDVSYVADFRNKIEFMLSATVYVNSDSILNDNKYDYETIGHPFMREIGQIIYNYERKRPRKYRPDLSAFRINYDHRDPGDKRKQLKDVDN